MTKTKISWTEETWNPIAGCSILSSGCDNCYAMKMAYRLEAMEIPKYQGTTRKSGNRTIWTGKINFDAKALMKPLSWKKPRRIFVNSMSDLFHENVKDEWIDQVFAVMALCRHHTFQVLTKRPERMKEYLESFAAWVRVESILNKLKPSDLWNGNVVNAQNILSGGIALPNVWLGVSVEDETTTDRIDILRKTPAGIRFISFEPLINDVGHLNLTDIQWAIVGGESDPNARPMHPDWARSLRDQCKAANVPFFFKQMSKKAAIPDEFMIREYPDAP